MQQAVALQYEEESHAAPRVVAKGQGIVGEKIVEIAHKEKIPIYVNLELTSLLYHVSLDSVIPPELYEVVAEVLTWAYSVNPLKTKKKANGGVHERYSV